jgi:hypothetical protein
VDDGPNACKTVDIKIVVRRTDSKKKGAVAANKRASRDDGVRKSSNIAVEKFTSIGVAVVKAPMSDKDAKHASQRRKQQDAKVNALGQRLPTKESSLKAARRKQEQLREEQEFAERQQAGLKKGAQQSYIDEDAEMTEEQMNPSKAVKAATNLPDRKLMIAKEEWSLCTDHSSADVTSMYLRKVSRERSGERNVQDEQAASGTSMARAERNEEGAASGTCRMSRRRVERAERAWRERSGTRRGRFAAPLARSEVRSRESGTSRINRLALRSLLTPPPPPTQRRSTSTRSPTASSSSPP